MCQLSHANYYSNPDVKILRKIQDQDYYYNVRLKNPEYRKKMAEHNRSYYKYMRELTPEQHTIYCLRYLFKTQTVKKLKPIRHLKRTIITLEKIKNA